MPLNSHFKMTTLQNVEPGELIRLSFMSEATFAIVLDTHQRGRTLGVLEHSKAPYTYAKINWLEKECATFGKDWQITPDGPIEFAEQRTEQRTRHQGGALVMHADGAVLNFKCRPDDPNAMHELMLFDLSTSTLRSPFPPEQDVVFTSWEIFMPEKREVFLERQSLLVRG